MRWSCLPILAMVEALHKFSKCLFSPLCLVAFQELPQGQSWLCCPLSLLSLLIFFSGLGFLLAFRASEVTPFRAALPTPQYMEASGKRDNNGLDYIRCHTATFPLSEPGKTRPKDSQAWWFKEVNVYS